MYRCFLCRFEVELDDVALLNSTGRCLCLRCYLRQLDQPLSVPETLQREIVASLAHVPDIT